MSKKKPPEPPAALTPPAPKTVERRLTADARATHRTGLWVQLEAEPVEVDLATMVDAFAMSSANAARIMRLLDGESCKVTHADVVYTFARVRPR